MKQSSRRPNKEQIKNQLLDLFVYNENINKKDLSARRYRGGPSRSYENY